MPTAEATYIMLGNQDLWETAKQCHRVLASAEIPYSVCGGVAVCLHGYRRNTVDLDLIIRPNDGEAVKQIIEKAGLAWDPQRAEFARKTESSCSSCWPGTAPATILRFAFLSRPASKTSK